MGRFFPLLGRAFMVGLPIALVVRVIYDFMHPENWHGPWYADPRRYWPILLIELLALLLLTWIAFRMYRKGLREATKREMINFVLEEARKKQAEGNWHEADEWLRCYDRILKYGVNWPEEMKKKS